MNVNSSRAGEWNEKYWDIISNLFLTPQYLGWKPISRSRWKTENGFVSVPADEIAASANALYSRKPMSKPEDIRRLINHKEEILNHIFNITFGIAGDAIVSKLFFEPLGIEDQGPFVSLGREIKQRYKLQDNITQQDALFVTEKSAIGIELKLGSKSSADQIMKYVALMVLEEERAKRPMRFGLSFIVPSNAIAKHWLSVGLESPSIDARYLDRLDHGVLNKGVSRMLTRNRAAFASVLDRLNMTVISWGDFSGAMEAIQQTLDCRRLGDQTAFRLLAGLRAQINTHEGTGLEIG